MFKDEFKDDIQEALHEYEASVIKFQEDFGVFVIATTKVDRKVGKELPKVFAKIEEMIYDVRQKLKKD